MVAVSVTRPSPEQRIRAALYFAQRGFGIFSVWSCRDSGVCRCPKGPECGSPGKHPITANGFKDATTDPERIRTLLLAGSQPNYGMVPPDGVFALDVDSDEERARLAELEAKYGPLPETLTTNTRNGQHIFLTWPEGYPRPIHKLWGFVTRWGSGRLQGYVIGPRSVHASGWEYEPASGALQIATLPDAWAAAGLEAHDREIVVAGAVLPDVGGRHDWLRDRARFYRGFIDQPEVLRAAILAENARLPQPKTTEEVERAIGDVMQLFPLDPVSVTEERIARRLGDDELDLLGIPSAEDFPEEPEDAAFDGVMGEMINDLAYGTDASTVGLLGALIAFCGAMLPGSAYFHRQQTSSPFMALVGESSVGRKGTAMTRVADAMSSAIGGAEVHRAVLDGINSGEGLVNSLASRAYGGQAVTGLVFEEEYASLIASRGREGSTLDPKMRQAFDGGPLSNRRARDSQIVNPPYWLPAIIGITPSELRQRLDSVALTNGSANRWLYLPVTRRKRLSDGSPPEFSPDIAAMLRDKHRQAQRSPLSLTVDPIVSQTLSDYSDFLPNATYGLSRDLSKRLPIIAFRIALVHAIVDGSSSVGIDHLNRALALTEYARRGMGWVFGDTIGNADANLLYRQLVQKGGLSANTITRGIIRDPIRRQAAIDELCRIGKAQVVTVSTNGRARSELVPTPGEGAFVHFVHKLQLSG